jgi:hypothetical protein
MAFAPSARARHSLAPPHRSGRETFHDAAGFASCYGPHRRSPSFRAFDAGLRPRPFPDEAASLLPGPLAATRTGLPPAGDDELTNKIHRYITASPPALLGARCGTRANLLGLISRNGIVVAARPSRAWRVKPCRTASSELWKRGVSPISAQVATEVSGPMP